jgi:hypothetical protein
MSSISANSVSEQPSPDTLVETKSDRNARIEKALRDREEHAKQDRERVKWDIGRSKAALTTTESETELMSFFVDAIREPTVCSRYSCHHRLLILRDLGQLSRPRSRAQPTPTLLYFASACRSETFPFPSPYCSSTRKIPHCSSRSLPVLFSLTLFEVLRLDTRTTHLA